MNSKSGSQIVVGTNLMDELDSGSFFDHIDDLLEFPADDLDADLTSGSGERDSFPSAFPGGSASDSFLGYDSVFSGNSASDLSAELSVPYEDIVQLEWLSNFVEDSFSGGSTTTDQTPATLLSASDPSHAQFHTSSPISVLESSTTYSNPSHPLPPTHDKKARTKRPRPPTFHPRPTIQLTSTHPRPKKPKTKPSTALPPNPTPAPLRKCLHCEITKTPQWRAGPMGPKTLCNACGVRYKSGRLFPEYRPAASPTFVPSVHSNSHKKVLEMRTGNAPVTST